MASSASRIQLSGSTNGKPISISAGGSPGNLIHTATASTTNVWDEIWLWLSFDTLIGTPSIVVEFGDATAPDHNVKIIPMYSSGPQLLIAGLMLQNSATVRVFGAATTSGNSCVAGFVNRVTN